VNIPRQAAVVLHSRGQQGAYATRKPEGGKHAILSSLIVYVKLHNHLVSSLRLSFLDDLLYQKATASLKVIDLDIRGV
jgi:hypothetical protein